MASAQAAQKSSRAPVVERLCLLEDDNQGLAQLCGPLEQNLRAVEAGLDVSIRRRGPIFEVSGAAQPVARPGLDDAAPPGPASPAPLPPRSDPGEDEDASP
jgi:phosphate starvation-inducible protein PhoH